MIHQEHLYTHTTCTHTVLVHTHIAQGKHTHTLCVYCETVDAVPGCSSSLEMEEVISCDMES